MSDSIFELSFVPRPIGLCLMPISIFHIVIPLSIINSSQLKIVVFSFAFFDSIDPLALIIISVDIILRPGPMGHSIQFLPDIGVLLLYNFLYNLLLDHFVFSCFGLRYDSRFFILIGKLLLIAYLFDRHFSWNPALLFLFLFISTTEPTPHSKLVFKTILILIQQPIN